MANNSVVTDDVKDTWLNTIRAAQAACSQNKGLALLHIFVIVDKNDPVAWAPVKLTKVHPARLADGNVNEELLALLLSMGNVEDVG
jgi:hypothetical protein